MQINKSNANISFQGNNLVIEGAAIKEGQKIPSFVLTAQDMSDLKSESFIGKPFVICAFPSFDTPVCSIEMKRFNTEASKLGDRVQILAVSMDLPFAQKRWCGSEGANNIKTGSDYKYRSFGKSFGCQIRDWALLARAVFVVDSSGIVTYCEYVQEVSSEPNYEEALKAVSKLLG